MGERLTRELPDSTLTEEGILAHAAPSLAEAVAGSGEPEASLAELGSGSSRKTRLLVEALLSRQGSLRYSPIDISASFLEESARALLDRYPRLCVDAIAGEYCVPCRTWRPTPDRGSSSSSGETSGTSRRPKPPRSSLSRRRRWGRAGASSSASTG